MAERKRVNVEAAKPPSHYFAKPSEAVNFIPSGSTLLDCVLGGGWAMNRIINIKGDKAVGKTLLVIEAAANFNNLYPAGDIYYNESEAAFDQDYASNLGMPVDKVIFVEDCFTVEDWFTHVDKVIDDRAKYKIKEPAIYVLDSLDGLSDEAEQNRGIGDGSFGASKAKKMSELFRRMTKRLASSNITLFIVSQVRDNIGVVIGRKVTSSGGRALGLYSSQMLYLVQTKKIERTHKSIKRPIGVRVNIMCDKNKIGLPYRKCDLDIIFGYGIDDITSNLNWLYEVGELATDAKALGVELKSKATDVNAVIKALNKLDDKGYDEWCTIFSGRVMEVWQEIETEFLPERSKYQ